MMKNLTLSLALLVVVSLLGGCAVAIVDSEGKTVSRSYPVMGGTNLVVINHVEGVKMEAEVMTPRYSGDRKPTAPAKTGEQLKFFFSNSFLYPRDRATVLLTFTTDEGVYVGMKEVSVKLKTRQGEFETEVEEIKSLKMPKRLKKRG
jgi:hypothetical protein